MPKVVITGDGSSNTINVSDPAEAVRLVAASLRKVGTDASVLSSMQTWANAGFKKPIRLTVQGKALVVDYRK